MTPASVGQHLRAFFNVSQIFKKNKLLIQISFLSVFILGIATMYVVGLFYFLIVLIFRLLCLDIRMKNDSSRIFDLLDHSEVQSWPMIVIMQENSALFLVLLIFTWIYFDSYC